MLNTTLVLRAPILQMYCSKHAWSGCRLAQIIHSKVRGWGWALSKSLRVLPIAGPRLRNA